MKAVSRERAILLPIKTDLPSLAPGLRDNRRAEDFETPIAPLICEI